MLNDIVHVTVACQGRGAEEVAKEHDKQLAKVMDEIRDHPAKFYVGSSFQMSASGDTVYYVTQIRYRTDNPQ